MLFRSIVRFVLLVGVLLLVGIGIAFVVTRDRRYLRLGWQAIRVMGLLAIAFALLYVFERVLLL